MGKTKDEEKYKEMIDKYMKISLLYKPKFDYDNIIMLIAWVFQPTNILIICLTIIIMILLR